MRTKAWLPVVTPVASLFSIASLFAADTPKPMASVCPSTVLAMPAEGVGAQDRATPKDWSQWDSVQRLTGQATIEFVATLDRKYGGGIHEDHNRTHDTVTVRFELERQRPVGYEGGTTWNAVRVSVQGMHTHSVRNKGFVTQLLTNLDETANFAQELREFGGMSLSLDHETGKWQITTPMSVDEPYEVQFKTIRKRDGKTDAESGTRPETNIQSLAFDGKADRKVGVLTALVEVRHREEDGAGGHRTTGRITILPDWNDVEVVVTIDGYEKWRPLGSIKVAGQAGNHLVAKAVLRPKDASASGDLPEVKQFLFELLDTSREPGVAMNWPKFSIDDSPDLMLGIDASSPGALSNEDQCLDVSNPAKNALGWPSATARVDSYDFGGRSELRVSAELADGRTIVGRLEGQDGTLYTEILLPKRLQRRWIAEAWLTENNVANLSDDDDNEQEPMGDGFNGDGLTLYEEYRGFAVRRMKDGRVEGDPKRKDFFILNLIGSDALTGIDLFEKNTGLRV
ncbi:MAG: hypothetical protein AB1649_22275, partial [Chloroflexota bacterium]